jgi:hypothetical protein
MTYGATDEAGDKVVDKGVSVPDLFATIVHLFGIDPTKSFPTPRGRPIAITDSGTVVRPLLNAAALEP